MNSNLENIQNSMQMRGNNSSLGDEHQTGEKLENLTGLYYN